MKPVFLVFLSFYTSSLSFANTHPPSCVTLVKNGSSSSIVELPYIAIHIPLDGLSRLDFERLQLLKIEFVEIDHRYYIKLHTESLLLPDGLSVLLVRNEDPKRSDPLIDNETYWRYLAKGILLLQMGQLSHDVKVHLPGFVVLAKTSLWPEILSILQRAFEFIDANPNQRELVVKTVIESLTLVVDSETTRLVASDAIDLNYSDRNTPLGAIRRFLEISQKNFDEIVNGGTPKLRHPY